MAEEFGSDDFVVPTLPEFGHDDVVVAPDDVVASVARGGTATPAEFQTAQRLKQLREEYEAERARPKYRIGLKLPFIEESVVSAPIAPEIAAFGAEAVKGVAPTGAGLAAASAVTPYSNAAANALAASPTPLRFAAPVVRFGVPLVAGALGGLGTRIVQDEALPAVLPDSAAESYELTNRLASENPNAALLGQFAGAGPFFRPGLPVGATGNARLAVPLIAGGIGAGVEGAQQLSRGEFDPQRLAIAGAGSALLNRETALGRRIGPNLVLPDIAGPAPTELRTVGRVLREPVLPEATTIQPAELSAVADANASAAADIAGAAQAGTTVDDLRIRRLAERMAGKTPEQKIAVLDQEVKLAGDTLSPAQERGALDMKQALQDQIEREKANAEAVKEAQAGIEAQQKAQADLAKAAQDQLAAAAEPPKSTQIIEQANAPQSLANQAAIGAKAAEGNLTQLQQQINQTSVALPKAVAATEGAITPAQSAPLPEPVESKIATIKSAVANKDTEWLYTVQRMPDGRGGFVQVDAINPAAEGVERNVVSSNPADLRKAGADIPDVPDWVPQGQYTREQIKEFIKQGEPKIPETRGQGIQYHGASKPFTLTEGGSYGGSEMNILGSGLYTTDALDIASSYRKKNRVPSKDFNPTVYEIKEKSPVKFFDLNAPISKEALDITGLSDGRAADIVKDAYDSIEGQKTLGKLFSEMRGLSREYNYPAYEIQSFFDDWAQTLSQNGYGGWKDIGGLGAGKGKVQPHEVKVYWFPENQVNLIPKNPLEKPSNALQKQSPSEGVLRAPKTESRPVVELPRVGEGNAVDQAVAGETGSPQPPQESRGINPRPPEVTRQASRMRQTRGAVSPKAILPIGGGAAGGITGYALTDREPGETDEEYQARRLRNAAYGAAAGAAGGAALGALTSGAQAYEQRLRFKNRPSGSIDLLETESGQGIRQTAEKVIKNKQYPEALRQTLANDPDIIYNKFALSDLAAKVSGATEAELAEMRKSPNIRDRLGATAELANRLSLSPDPSLQAQGAALYSELAQSLTDPAQLLGLGKLVKTPEGYITALNEQLKGVNRQLSEPQVDTMRRLAADSIRSEQELAAASRAAESDFSQANENAYRAAQKKNADAQKALDDFVHRVAPEDWSQLLSKTIQGNLLTPLSLVANVFGNVVYQPVRRTAASFATALDGIYSAASGRPMKISRLNPLPSTGELAAAAEGIKIAGRELLTGPSSDSYIKGEVQRGFRPLRSLAQAFSGEDLAVRPDGTVALNDRAKKLYEGLAGVAPETMFRFLSLGDKPFRRAAEAEILLEQARIKGLKGRDLDRFLEFPDKATQELINTEGRSAIFAQDNKFSTRLNSFLDHGLAEAVGADKVPALKDAIKVFGRVVVPFRQFPLNYVNTALNFAAPELAFAKSIYYGSKGDRRKALMNIGEGALGAMIYGAANYLWDKKLISEPTDKDAKQRTVQYEQMGPQRINISGLNRALDGGDGSYKIGDLTMDWGRLGIPAASFYVFTRNAAKGRQESARTGENRNPAVTPDTFVANRLSALPGMAAFALDQSFLSGTSGLLDAMRNPDPDGQEFQNWASNTFRAVSSIPVPNTVEALARANFQYIPELKGDNLTETLGNIWRYKTLQVSDADRPLLKRDLWGDPISRTQPGENPYITQFVDVTKAQRKEPDPFKQNLVDLYKVTESPDVYPQIPGRNITVEGITVKLTPDDYDKYQQLVGNARRQYAQQIVDNPQFSNPQTIPEAKILALQEAYSEGVKTAKQQFLSRPGVAEKYFPELIGKPIAPPATSRVMSRDPKARGRLRETQPVETFGEDDTVAVP